MTDYVQICHYVNVYLYPRVPLSLKILGGGVRPVRLSLNPRLLWILSVKYYNYTIGI